jgi:Mg-chelatase subunit ChlD
MTDHSAISLRTSMEWEVSDVPNRNGNWYIFAIDYSTPTPTKSRVALVYGLALATIIVQDHNNTINTT